MEEERSNIIKAITTPLGFFALSLLIVEGFLGITLGFAKVENQYFYWTGMVIGATLFILVVVFVFVLVWRKPRNLILGGKEYLDLKKTEMENEKTRFKELSENTAEDVNQEKYEF